MDSTVQLHTLWCDRFHLVVGSPQCSAIYQLDKHRTLMRTGNSSGLDQWVLIINGQMYPGW